MRPLHLVATEYDTVLQSQIPTQINSLIYLQKRLSETIIIVDLESKRLCFKLICYVQKCLEIDKTCRKLYINTETINQGFFLKCSQKEISMSNEDKGGKDVGFFTKVIKLSPATLTIWWVKSGSGKQTVLIIEMS